jgi:hypothetical protein
MVMDALNQTQASLAKERPLIPLLFEPCEMPLSIQQLTLIDFTNPANFDWCLRKLLEALNIDLRNRFVSKDEFDGRDFRVEGLRAHQSSGETFVDVVAKVYRWQHFEVQLAYQWEGVTFDLMVKKSGFIHYQAVVTCIDVYCDLPQCRDIVKKYTKVFKLLGDFQWIVLAAAGFSQQSFNHLTSLKMHCTTYAELLNQLVPLQEYVDNFMIRYQDEIVNRIWDGNDWFIPPDICTDIEKNILPALTHISQWMGKSGENLMTIWGDLGTGKTTLANYLAFQWAQAFKDDPLHHPAPVLIPLRDVRKAINLESLIISHLSYNGLPNVSYAHFEFLLRLGKVILLFYSFTRSQMEFGKLRYRSFVAIMPSPQRSVEHSNSFTNSV